MFNINTLLNNALITMLSWEWSLFKRR